MSSTQKKSKINLSTTVAKYIYQNAGYDIINQLQMQYAQRILKNLLRTNNGK
jgi:TPP-dependent trihydroxycyclohexane-1,2-dione (THcHDO) dehydratase